MANIDNRSDLPHAWFQKLGPGGHVFDVLTVRGTFHFTDQDQALIPAAKHSPIVYGDEYLGLPEDNPLKSVLGREGDLVLFKPSTDVYLSGTAHAEGHTPRGGWLASMQVGPVRKTLQLHGPRHFERRRFGGWRLSSADPVAAVPLDYRKAFGGSFSTSPSEQSTTEYLYKPDNPAGCGWLPNIQMLRQLSKSAREEISDQIARLREFPAPQIEAPDQPVTHPSQQYAAQGFGPLARWCEPRIRHAGTYDDTWQQETYPYLPDDFDPRFFQSAPADLICPRYLDGNEAIELEGLLPDGKVNMRLPDMHLLAAVTTINGSKQSGPLVLDTVAIDLDDRQVTLVWRGTFDRINPVREVALGAITAPDRERAHMPAEVAHG